MIDLDLKIFFTGFGCMDTDRKQKEYTATKLA
jgi:hypothetical protein